MEQVGSTDLQRRLNRLLDQLGDVAAIASLAQRFREGGEPL